MKAGSRSTMAKVLNVVEKGERIKSSELYERLKKQGCEHFPSAQSLATWLRYNLQFQFFEREDSYWVRVQ